jgi:predicted TIM-barrel fold metal-dependent hydrolase
LRAHHYASRNAAEGTWRRQHLSLHSYDVSMPLIIDTHVHVYRTKAEGLRAKGAYDIWEYGVGGEPHVASWAGDADDALASMAAANVDYAVVTNLLDPPSGPDAGLDLIAFNEWVLSLAASRPSFLACLAVDPRYLPVDHLVPHIRALALRGNVVGIKLHPPMQEIDLSDEAMWPIFEACVDLGLRVVAHSGPSRKGIQHGEPNAFRPLLKAFPNLKLALAHLGGGAWAQTRQLAADHPNVYFDACEIIEWLGATQAPTPTEFVALVRDVGIERVMMGSDFPWYDMKHTTKLIAGLPGLSEEERLRLLGQNARDFFELAV